MIVSFLETTCKEPIRKDALFGLCDEQNNTKAYSDSTDGSKWIAKVINDTGKEITFTAIDNCITILKEGTNDKESTCDGMLIFADTLYLVELKKKRGDWLPDAIGQLKNTIKLLYTNHSLEEFKYKKAYACNKKHPYFTIIDDELNKKLYRETGFRIDAQREIVIK